MGSQDIVGLERGTTDELKSQIPERLERGKKWTTKVGKNLQSFPIYLLSGFVITQNPSIITWIVAIILTGIEHAIKVMIKKV